MKLTVGLLTSNCAHLIADQLDSLDAGLAGVDDWYLVIADSASTDDTVEVARRLRPDATVVVLPGNLGFAAQANAVMTAVPGVDAVLILSRTALLRPGCAKHLLDALADGRTGVAVPKTYDRNGEHAPSLRLRPTLLRAWVAAVFGGRLAARVHPSLSEVLVDTTTYAADTRFDWATGAVTAFSVACATAVGGWDESYFLYSEETDFELRAAEEGFALRYVPQAEATHLGGDSEVRPEFWAHLCANRVRLYGKQHGRLAADAFWLATILGQSLRLRTRGATRRAAIAKLWRERRALVAGRPAIKPEGY
ncbi:MAG TPA: glycosyltransferase family 2 protein [Micromonosporaceae bacterium]|jgi:GT2 family glycosyltransferase